MSFVPRNSSEYFGSTNQSDRLRFVSLRQTYLASLDQEAQDEAISWMFPDRHRPEEPAKLDRPSLRL